MTPHQETARTPPDSEFDWDGHSPINGEAVTGRAKFGDDDLVFTASRVYRVRPKYGYVGDRAPLFTMGL